MINKVATANPDALEKLRRDIHHAVPSATLIEADLEVTTTGTSIENKRVVIVEDGPTITHGGMATGAGWVAAKAAGADIVDPRPGLSGSLQQVFEQYPHIGKVLPAMGYAASQIEDLRISIEATDAEVLVDASPADLLRLMTLSVPVARARYTFVQRSGPPLLDLVESRLKIATT